VRAHPAADPTLFLAQETRLFSSLHDGLKPRLADNKVAGLRVTSTTFIEPTPADRTAHRWPAAVCR